MSIDKPYILGADECGLGSLAGPCVACGVRAPKDWLIPGLNDSKQLTNEERRIVNVQLLLFAEKGDIQYHIASRTNEQIDNQGLYVMLKDCYKEIASKLYDVDTLIVIDGNLNFDGILTGMDHQSVIKADTKIPAVMAASIIGKVYRDDLMIALAKEHPEYNWHTNVGYITPPHIAAIKKYGYTQYHRRSYKVKGLNK